jgi:hypothetical protein
LPIANVQTFKAAGVVLLQNKTMNHRVALLPPGYIRKKEV